MFFKPTPLLWRTSLLSALIVAIHLHPSGGYPQRFPAAERHSFRARKPLFLFDAYNFISRDPSRSRLDVHLALANDILQFVKEEENLYRARYEININILDEKKELATSEIWKEEIIAHSFEETNSRERFKRSTATFNLAPGKYTLWIEITDLDIKKSFRRTKAVLLRDYTKEKIGLSDVVIADTVEFDSSEVKKMVPNLWGNFEDSESNFYAYFEIYPQISTDSLSISYRILDSYESPIFKKSYYRKATKGKTLFECIDLKNILSKPGGYYLTIKVTARGYKNTRRKKFYMRWADLPFLVDNLDSAIEPMQYIMKGYEFKALIEATEEKKQKLFEQFWQQRDPTPGTEVNELKQEFYRRVDFAEKNFTVYFLNKEGWRTDRGRIYIIYGPPTQVQRNYASPDRTDLDSSPYELWYYANIGRKFVFVDRSGVGDYELVSAE